MLVTIVAVIGIPATAWGVWKGIRGFVHATDIVGRILVKLDKETATNGATHAAQAISSVLPSNNEPSTKDVLSAILVAQNQLLQAQEHHDQAAAVRTEHVVDAIEKLVQAPKER